MVLISRVVLRMSVSSGFREHRISLPPASWKWRRRASNTRMPGLLKKFKVKRFVTAHTPQPGGRITARFGNTLYLIDTGMLDGKFYPGGGPSALEIVGDEVKQIYLK